MIKPERSEPARGAGNAVLHGAGGAQALRIRTAHSFWSRFRGLMLAKPLPQDEGLLIPRCASVHTGFMRVAIDVVYLDRTGRVLQCVEALRPWRASAAWRLRGPKPSHCLELAAGTIARLGVAPGDRLEHLEFAAPAPGSRAGGALPARPGQRGAAMVEFVVVGPVLALMGLSILQYAMMYFAKNQIDHAAFMAARAGSTAHAKLDTIKEAYLRNLIALYGGGTTNDELNKTLDKVRVDAASNVEVQLLNPTKQSYDDWNDSGLEKVYGHRAIRNGGQAFRDPSKVGRASGQNIQDANLIKLRIVHGYEPKVPLVRLVYIKYLQWLDTHADPKASALIDAGRVPIVTHVTMQMQSDPIEGPVVSSPGPGNGGKPVDPGDPPITHEPPPACATAGCTVDPTPVDPGPPSSPPSCGDGTTLIETASADVLFDFDSATLNAAGRTLLDQVIEQAQTRSFESLTLTGYTDPIGTDAYNLKLSRDRAQAVSDYLKRHGFPAKPITVDGKGAADPLKTLADCPAGPTRISCLAPDRRVVFTFMKVK